MGACVSGSLLGMTYFKERVGDVCNFYLFFIFQNQSFLFWFVRYRLTLSGLICVGQVIALDHASIELESNKELNPTIMYTDSERAEKCSRHAQDSLFLNFLPCFELLCNISYYMSHNVDSTATIGWTLVLWGTNACKCGQFDCENEQWVGNKCFACVLIFLRRVYQLYLRTNIYIYIYIHQLLN